MRVFHLNVRESKIVSDSRFHAIDFRFHALNSSLCWWDLDSGLQSLVRFQIPKSMILDSTGKFFPDSGIHEQKFPDSGFHEQTSRIPESRSKASRIPESTSKTSRIPDSTSKTSRILESGFPYMGRSGINPWNLPTPRNKVTARLPANDSAQDLQLFTPNDVHTHEIRPGVRCRLRNGVISSCVESFLDNVDLRLPLCLQRQYTPVTAFSETVHF